MGTQPSKQPAILIALALTQVLSADDWPQWRGPNQDGVSAESSWSHDWSSRGPNRLWSAKIGEGSGAPAIVGDRVYIIGVGGENRDIDTVFCLNATTGEEVWKHETARKPRDPNKRYATKRTSTNSAPTVDSGYVYTNSGDAVLTCFHAETGKVRWQADSGGDGAQYDHQASPVIAGNLVVIPARLEGASLIAFDKNTGKEAWRTWHKTRSLGGFWSTPVLAEVDGKACLVYLSGLAVVGVDPRTGETQWKFDFAEAGFNDAWRGAVAASPIVRGNLVFFPFHPDHRRGLSGCLEIRGGKAELRWKSLELAHWWHSPVLLGDLVLALDQGPAAPGAKAGALFCYDLASGQKRWSTHDLGERSRELLTRGAMMTAAGDRVLVLNDYGYLNVVKISAESYELLATAKVTRGNGWTAPVLANGRLYCRDKRLGEVICYDVAR